jgi:tripartite ATP-independent transporter DctM subunit
MILAVIGLFAGLIIFGVPIAYSMGLATTLALLFGINTPLYVMAHKMSHGINSFVILAIPLYILAGSLMETGGIAKRLVALGLAMVGWVRGGLAMTVVPVEYLFSGLSGSTTADVSAVGSMLIPSMVRAGYTAGYAVAVVSAATSMGMLVPPCINMVVAGGMVNISVGALFLGGFLPALVMAVLILVLIYWQARRHHWRAEEKVTVSKFFQALKGAIIPLGMPVIIFGGIIGGIVTPTEAGVLAVVYALLVGGVIYREFRFRDLYRITLEAGITSGIVGIMMGIGSVFAWWMTTQKISESITAGMLSISASPFVFVLLSAAIFMVVGTLLEGLPALIVLLPTMYPVVQQLHIDPIYYVNVVIAAVGIGLFMPPIGIGMLIACSIAKVDITTAIRSWIPFCVVLIIGLLIMILFPSITLVVPRVFGLIR